MDPTNFSVKWTHPTKIPPLTKYGAIVPKCQCLLDSHFAITLSLSVPSRLHGQQYLISAVSWGKPSSICNYFKNLGLISSGMFWSRWDIGSLRLLHRIRVISLSWWDRAEFTFFLHQWKDWQWPIGRQRTVKDGRFAPKLTLRPLTQ